MRPSALATRQIAAPDSSTGNHPLTRQFTDPAALAAVASVLRQSTAEIESSLVGTSMGNTMPSGSHIRIRCSGTGEWLPEAVVVFFVGNSLVTHRVIARGRWRRTRQYWVTRGDGRMLCDSPVQEDTALGVVTAWRGDSTWTSVPLPQPTSIGRRLISTCSELVTQITLEIHPAIAVRLTIGLRVLATGLRKMRA